MSEENYAGNIIISLANMPDFLRKPILKKRMIEFYTLDETEQKSIIYNALQAAPNIPFANFGKLFGTWLSWHICSQRKNKYTCLHRLNRAEQYPSCPQYAGLEWMESRNGDGDEALSMAHRKVLKKQEKIFLGVLNAEGEIPDFANKDNRNPDA